MRILRTDFFVNRLEHTRDQCNTITLYRMWNIRWRYIISYNARINDIRLYLIFFSSETQNTLKSPPYNIVIIPITTLPKRYFLFSRNIVGTLSKKRVNGINRSTISMSFSKLLETRTYGIMSNWMCCIFQRNYNVYTSLYKNHVRLEGNEQFIIETIYMIV